MHSLEGPHSRRASGRRFRKALVREFSNGAWLDSNGNEWCFIAEGKPFDSGRGHRGYGTVARTPAASSTAALTS
jgi:hypothetical protein